VSAGEGAAAGTLSAAQRRSVLVGLVVGLPLSAVFLALAVRNVDLDRVRDVLADARPGFVLAGVAAIALVYALQATRWSIIARVPSVSWTRYAEMVVSGVACNNILPGRLGDILRARWLSLAGRIPGGRALATVVLDRVADVATLVLFLLVSLWFVTDAAWLRWLVAGGLVLLLLTVGLLLFARAYTARRTRERHERRGLLRRLARDTAEGLAEPLGRRRIALVALTSVAAWSAWALAAVLVARAVGIDLSATDALFTAAVLNLGVAIPSSPGFIGTYQWLAVSALGLLDVDRERALAFAILVHAAWYVPTTLVGGAFLLVGGVRRLRARGVRPSQETAAR
jgi:uncharacterized protein (TIRG00374 family)